MNRRLKFKASSCVIFSFEMAIILSSSVLSNETWMNIVVTILTLMGVFCVVINRGLMKTVLPLRKFIVLLVLLCFSIITIKYTLAREFLMLVVVAWGISNENAHNIIKSYLNAKIIGTFSVITLGVISFSGSQMTGRSVGRLGFANANALGMELACIILLVFAAWYDKKKKGKWITFIIAGVAGIFFLSGSLTPALGLVGLVLLLMTTWWKNIRIVRKMLPALFVLLTGLSIWIACSYQELSPVWMKLNEYSSGRFYCYHWYYTHMPITMMGNIFYTGKLWALDNAYLCLLFRYGIITLLIYALLFWKMTKFYMDNDNDVLLMCAIVYEVMAFAEFGPMSIANNFTLAVYIANYQNNYKNRTDIEY